jgi:DNA-binding MarR family transcriptional regulator
MAKKSKAEKLRILIHAFVRNFGLLDQTRTPCGMPISVSDAHALMELLKDRDIKQVELSKRLGLSKSATTRLIQRLITRGQVNRTNSDDDGRAYNLQLTERGIRQAKMINHESMATFNAIISGMPEDAIQKLLQSLPPLIHALSKSRRKTNSIHIHNRKVKCPE